MFSLTNKKWMNGFLASLVVGLIAVYPELRSVLEQLPFVQENPWVIPVLTFLVGLFTRFYKQPEQNESDEQVEVYTK